MITPKQIKRSSSKKLTLKIDDKGDLIVSAPNGLSNSEIFKFVEQKQTWIKKKQNEIKTIILQNQQILNFEECFYLGKRCAIAMVQGLKTLEYRNQTFMLPQGANRKNTIKAFYMKEAEKILVFRLNYLTSVMNIQPKECKIIASKAKWGMCDSKKVIYLNYKLIMLPPDIIDYVIVHELCHIEHNNHSKEFYGLLEQYIPEYSKIRKWMRENSHKYTIKLK